MKTTEAILERNNHNWFSNEIENSLGSSYQELSTKLKIAADKHPERFTPLLHETQADTELLEKLGTVKRFLELWTADPKFRDLVEEDVNLAFDRAGLDRRLVSPSDIRALYDEEYALECLDSETWVPPLIYSQYRNWCAEKVLHREHIRMTLATPSHAGHRAWRNRQMKRVLGQLGFGPFQGIVHAPFAIELSDGCSVGCWFCGVSAEKRMRDFPYSEENAILWRGVLSALRNQLGPAAAEGFNYWATDPLDNPDYEQFCLDMARILGRFPQTTTAQSQKHIERLRKLLPLSREHGCPINRFSILSLPILRKIHAAFTPGELLHTELITQNMEANTMQSNSGRARNSNRLEKKSEFVNLDENWREQPGTISCVSGFLINMVTKTVKMVSPTPCDDVWPNGYFIYEEGTFTDSADFGKLIAGMAARHMPEFPPMGKIARFRRDITPSKNERTLTLQSWGLLSNFELEPGLDRIADSLTKGDKTFARIIEEAETLDHLPLEEAYVFLCHLFDQGLLDEEPLKR